MAVLKKKIPLTPAERQFNRQNRLRNAENQLNDLIIRSNTAVLLIETSLASLRSIADKSPNTETILFVIAQIEIALNLIKKNPIELVRRQTDLVGRQ
jgi:hypothetical protein